MWSYRNSRTGQVQELSARSARLDALANWHLVDAPMQGEELEEPEPPTQVVTVTAEPAAERVVLVRPPNQAPKPAWVAYAVAQGANETDARVLSKAALIEEWGGTDGED